MLKVVDCSGMLCPKPLIATRKALKENPAGTPLEVIVDNDTSCKNVQRFLADNGLKNSMVQEGKRFRIHINVPENLPVSPRSAEEYCEASPSGAQAGGFIVLLNSPLMGKGDDSLGKILMKGFLNTITELNPLPAEVICYNSGVQLARKNTDTAVSLKKLGEAGVRVTLCGTCVDFFNLKDEIEVGTISNMLYITERLTSNLKIVQP